MSEPSAEPGASVPEAVEASETLEALRERFEPAATMDEEVSLPVLPHSSTTYRLAAAGYEPLLEGEESPAARVVLGRAASDWSEVRDVASSVSWAFRLRGLQGATARAADGYLVYRGDAGSPTRLFRAGPEGAEDYLLFDRAPTSSQLRYEIELGDEVRGLRLVASTLEALDWEGTPRLRVSPPFLIGSDGRRVDGSLEIEGCAVDTDSAGPWGRVPTPPGASTCTLVVSWSGDEVAYPALLDPSWTTTGAMTIPRAQHTAVFMRQPVLPHRHYILVAGGLTTGGAVTASAEIFDLTTNTYAATQSMATARHRHTATVTEPNVSTQVAMVVGGFTTRNATPSANGEKFDSVSYTWTTLPNMNTARAAHAAAAIHVGAVTVCGGILSDGTASSSCGYYSAATNSWTTLPVAMPTPRAYHSMVYGMTSGGSPFPIIIGGTDGTTSAQQILGYGATWGAPAQFEVIGQLQVPRHRHTVTTLPSLGNPVQYLIAGGVSSVAGQPDVVTPSTEIFATGPRKSVRSANMTTPRRDHSATEFLGRVLIAGGFDSAGAATSSAELYQTVSEVILDVPAIASARGYHSAIANQLWPQTQAVRVIVAGGTSAASPSTGSTYSSNSEAYSHFTPAIPLIQPWTYRFTPGIDALVSPSAIEIYGTIYAPETFAAGVRHPVVVLMHGAHGACGTGSNPRVDDRSYLGGTSTCPAGYSEVQNHRGYDYLAVPLAERGYIVLSLNANRGVESGDYGDDGFILRRGRLLLRHLKMLSEWDRGVATTTPRPAQFPDFQGHVDFDQVGLIGHSRGGEATRSALYQYRATGSVWPTHVPGLNVRAMLEIAPTDYITYQSTDPLTLNAAGVKWATILPMCDGDVRNLDGIRAFDRMLLDPVDSPAGFKATYTVWGANHNYFNSVWQRSELAATCINHRALFSAPGTPGEIGSGEQRQSAFQPIYRFVTGTVGTGADINQARIFNPAYATPPEPRIDRGYTPSTASAQSLMLENFLGAAGTGSYSVANGSSGVTVTHGAIAEHAPNLRAGTISWASTGNGKYFQSNWSATGSGFNLSTYGHLELRMERSSSSATVTSVNVQLVNSNNTLSGSVSLASYAKLTAPVGSTHSLHTMLQSVRIPLTAFSGVTLSAVRGVRVSFTTNGADAFLIANIRATKNVAGQPLLAAEPESLAVPSPQAAPRFGALPLATGTPLRTITAGNRVLALRSQPAQAGAPARVTLELEVTEEFGVRDAILALRIGGAEFRSFEYSAADGRTNRARFSLPRSAFDALQNGAPIRVAYPDVEWEVGVLDKARLDR